MICNLKFFTHEMIKWILVYIKKREIRNLILSLVQHMDVSEHGQVQIPLDDESRHTKFEYILIGKYFLSRSIY